MADELLTPTDRGLYCAAGDFHVDPWRPVPRAVVTHAHADHLTRDCGSYLISEEGVHVTRARLSEDAVIETLPYGRTIDIHGVRVSLHPAGHILGSSQVRIEHRGRVLVVSGDYKTEPDRTCAPFEPVRCHTFLTESTFGLPIYRWPAEGEVFAAINAWWRSNREKGLASLLFGYSLGKAQRLLSGLDPSIGPILTHGAVETMTAAYRVTGATLPPTTYAGAFDVKEAKGRALVIAPPSAQGSRWAGRFGPSSGAFASGWMTMRGTRRRRAIDRGFVLSDHADWAGLLGAIVATGAERVLVTHGYASVLVKWLREHGRDADVVPTRFIGERDDAPEPRDAESEPEEAAS
jgi:putative mRNA 3-end processing factor